MLKYDTADFQAFSWPVQEGNVRATLGGLRTPLKIQTPHMSNPSPWYSCLGSLYASSNKSTFKDSQSNYSTTIPSEVSRRTISANRNSTLKSTQRDNRSCQEKNTDNAVERHQKSQNCKIRQVHAAEWGMQRALKRQDVKKLDRKNEHQKDVLCLGQRGLPRGIQGSVGGRIPH